MNGRMVRRLRGSSPLSHVVPGYTSRGCTGYGVMARIVSRDTADKSTLDAPFRLSGRGRQHNQDGKKESCGRPLVHLTHPDTFGRITGGRISRSSKARRYWVTVLRREAAQIYCRVLEPILSSLVYEMPG
jgi:hypothetical protein